MCRQNRRHNDHRTSQLHSHRLPGNQFNGNVAPEVAKLVASDTVRILDLVFVAKDEQGDTISLEFDQMDELAAFNDIDGEVAASSTRGPRPRGASLPEGNSALVILWRTLGCPARRGDPRLGRGAHRQRPHPERPRRGGVRRAGRGTEELRTEKPKREGARPCP